MSERPPVVAINPGTFDPVTFGHLDVITRAANVFDRVVVGVVRDPHHKKSTMFTVEERVGFLEEALSRLDNVVVDVFSTLVVEFARKHGAKTMIKGLRVIADFEWEFQMNRLNQMLAPEIETMYVMSSPEYSFISSSAVKEIAAFGGKVDELVPAPVAVRFREMFPNGRPGAPLIPSE
jgi:pantetheine-phosphate adenylyltransferase